MKKFFKILILIIILILMAIVIYFYADQPSSSENINWGVAFSQKQAQFLGLDWKKLYSAMLDDLGFKKIKIATHWDLLESQKDEYDFSDLDWQIAEAKKYGAQVVLAIGLKTPRWPECHLPNWAVNLSSDKQQKEIEQLIQKIISRYHNEEIIVAWQVENEPYFPFGECPKRIDNFLEREIELIKSFDTRPIILTDSGEWSMWFRIAKKADIVGISLYRHVYSTTFAFLHKILPIFPEGFYLTYPFPPKYFYAKAKLIEKIFHKPVIVTELQAEPWLKSYTTSEIEEARTMNLEKLKDNINFVKHSGLKEVYFWGVEWWYFKKEIQNNPTFWNEIKNLISTNLPRS